MKGLASRSAVLAAVSSFAFVGCGRVSTIEPGPSTDGSDGTCRGSLCEAGVAADADAGETVDTARYDGSDGSWARTFPGGNPYGPYPLLAVGANGDVIVAISRLLPFDDSTYRLSDYVARLDPGTGATVWGRRFDSVHAVAIDPAGGSAVVAEDWSGPPVLTRLDPSGRELWAKPLAGDYGYQTVDIAFDRDAALIIARTVLNEGCCTLDAPAPRGYVDLEKLDAGGARVFRWQFGDGTSYIDHASVVVDGAGNIGLFVADVTGTVGFGAGPEDFSGGASVVASYDPSGQHLWHRRLSPGLSRSSAGRTIAADGAGNIIVTGMPFHDTGTLIDLGLGPFACPSYSGLLLGLSRGGATSWNRCLEGFGTAAVGARPAGALIAGAVGRPVAGPTSVGGPVLNGDAAGDGLVAYYDSTGAWLGQDATTEPGMQTFGSVVADAKGTVFLGGVFDARFTLPGTMLIEPFAVDGSATSFVARLAPRP